MFHSVPCSHHSPELVVQSARGYVKTSGYKAKLSSKFFKCNSLCFAIHSASKLCAIMYRAWGEEEDGLAL